MASASNGRGGLWAPDGSTLFSPEYDTGLWRVPASGGVAQPVVSPETAKGERSYRWPDLLPGGRAVLFTVGSLDSPNDYDKARIVAYSFAAAERRVVVDGANMARFVPPGTLVYSRAGVLYAVAFDPDRLEVKGQAAPVLEGVAGDPGSGATYFAVATDGTLAVVRGAGSKANRLLTLVDRKGVATRLPLTARGFRHPRFSPDGTRLAFTVGSASGLGMDADVWVYSLSSGSLSRLTFGGNVYPAWTPGGDRISYVRGRDQALVTKPADGTAAEEQLEAPVANDASFRAGPPRILVADLSRYMTSTAPQLDWDAAPAGDRFVFIEVERAKDEGTRIDIALHWARHLATASPGSQGLAR